VRSARKHLENLEVTHVPATPQAGLFDTPKKIDDAEIHPALDALDDLKPDELSPREALDKLYQLKKLRETKI
jgi:DNA mismatch repair protein MutS